MNNALIIFAVAGVALIGMTNGPGIQAQSTPTAGPSFTVASIKPCKAEEGSSRGGGSWPPNVDPIRLSLNCLQLDFLIREAYLEYETVRRAGGLNIFAIPITGEPGWLQSERFNIEAKTDSPVSQRMMLGPMLRALLEDRFKLKIHRETREVPTYELTVAKGGEN